MASWRINFKGFACVEADTAEQAMELYQNGCASYEEQEEEDPIEVRY